MTERKGRAAVAIEKDVRPVRDERVSVLGLGYVGLPTAVLFAAEGLQVLGVDIDERVRRDVAAGRIPFVEPGMGEVLQEVVARGALTVHAEPAPADVHVIAVPTPLDADRGADLSAVISAVRALTPRLRGGELIILESTSPPGTTRLLARTVQELRPDLAIDGLGEAAVADAPPVQFAHCPERVLPGRALIELRENPRAIGGLSEAAGMRAAALYARVCRAPLRLTTADAAELTKLAENAFRDVNIAFANELANVCEALDIDVWDVIDVANLHPRVDILRPGPGVGGHCIAVDPWFIISAAPEATPLLRAARGVNDARPSSVVQAVRARLAASGGTEVACLGLSFKPDIDDLRGSPAIDVVRGLTEGGQVAVTVVEPHISQLPEGLSGRPGVRLAPLEEVLAGDLPLVVLVDHRQFAQVPAGSVRDRLLVDTRGLWVR